MNSAASRKILSLEKKAATLSAALGLGPGMAGMNDRIANSAGGRRLLAIRKQIYSLSALSR